MTSREPFNATFQKEIQKKKKRKQKGGKKKMRKKKRRKRRSRRKGEVECCDAPWHCFKTSPKRVPKRAL